MPFRISACNFPCKRIVICFVICNRSTFPKEWVRRKLLNKGHCVLINIRSLRTKKCSKILSGDQPRQSWLKNQRSGELPSPSSGSMWGQDHESHIYSVAVCLSLTWEVVPRNLMFWLLSYNMCPGAWSDGLIRCYVLPLQISPAYTRDDECVPCILSLWINLSVVHTLFHNHTVCCRILKLLSPKPSFSGFNTCEIFLVWFWVVFKLNLLRYGRIT
jgi:hypothetical protein